MNEDALPGEPGRWRTLLFLLGLTVVAALQLLPYLGNQSLSFDETFTRVIALSGSPRDVWDAAQATESTPPLFYLLEWGWLGLTGREGDAALRVVPALAGVAVAPLTFLALRHFTGERIAIGAGALAAVSPVLNTYSLSARSYPLLILLCLASVWALARVLRQPTWGNGTVWAVTASAAMWTHYFAFFTVATEVGVMVVCLSAARRRVAAWTATAAALTAPVLLVLSQQLDDRAGYIATAGLASRVQSAIRQFAMGPNVPHAALEGAGLVLAGGALLVGAVELWRRGRDGRVVLALALVPILVPLLVALAGYDKHFIMRNLLAAWVPLAAVVAAGLWRLRAVPLAAYAALGVVTVLWVQADWRYQNADVKGAIRTLQPQAAGLPVLTYPEGNTRVVLRYRGGTLQPSVVSDTVWVMSAPQRSVRRTFDPVDDGPRRLPAGLVPTGRRLGVHGFRMFELRSPGPTALTAASFGLDKSGRRGALLVPDMSGEQSSVRR